MNPAYRFGAQQADKLRAVDDLKKSMTYEATATREPIDLLSWGQLAPMCMLFVSVGGKRPLPSAKADRADMYKQPPLLERDELAAAGALQNPPDGAWYGFASKARLFESGVIAPVACRFLKIPSCPEYGFLKIFKEF